MGILGTPRLRTVGAATALTVTMATLALLHDGTETADLDLNDGGVWVTNHNVQGTGRAVAGHLNYLSHTIDSYTEPASGQFDISQQANDVVLHDEQSSQIASIDTKTWQPGSFAGLPAGGTAVQGGDVVAITDGGAGNVWVIPAASAHSFNPSADPALRKKPGIRATVDVHGGVHTVTPDGTLRDLHREGQSWQVEEVGSVPKIDKGDVVELTAVGDRAVVVNKSAGWVAWGDERTDVDGLADAQVQQQGAAVDVVAIAMPDALLQIPLDGGDVRTTEVGKGVPIAPVAVGDCVYAAWTGSGQYLRDCEDDDQDVAPAQHDVLLRPQAPEGSVVFRTNRNLVVLNDITNGDVILVNEDMEMITDWSDVKADIQSEEQEKDKTKEQVEFERQKENRPPDPKPDEFGVREGQAATLPVVANDTDPDGDVLLATPEGAKGGILQSKLGPISQVRNGRALRIVPTASAGQKQTFTYVASDGRKNGEGKAQVTLSVHPESQNAGPRNIADRTSSLTMTQLQKSAKHHILQECFDPDGDPFWIDHVEYPKGMDGTFSADGVVTLSDDGTQDPGRRVVPVFLTDGRDMNKVDLVVTVQKRDAIAKPTANADYVRATQGEPVLIRPLTNDTDPAGNPLSIIGIADVPGATISGDFSRGSFFFNGSQPGTSYVEYSITNGPGQADGVVRVDVMPKDGGALVPVPDDDIAVLPTAGEVLVDVLGNDSDPLGGVLVLQSASQADGVRVSVVDHSVLRIKDEGMGRGTTRLTYQVANAAGAATGSVTVVSETSTDKGTPLAYPDHAVVRSGDVVTVDVMRNDVSPGKRELHVSPTLDVVQAGDLGTAFVSDDKVRFKAEGKSGTVRMKYSITDPDGNAATADLTVDIVPVNGANSAPSPQPLTARVVQGSSTRVQVPLDGLDPDGDSVTLLGLKDPPAKGTVTFDGGVMTYSSAIGLDGVGTDSFTYLVEDPFGASAEGNVSVGIAPRPAMDEPPIPAQDAITVRPGRLVSVPVLSNDIDPEGGQLALVDGSVKAADKGTDAEAEVVDGRAELTTPDEAGVLRYAYVVKDEAGNRATGSLTVTVDPNAPLQPPAARDDLVPLSALVGEDTVTVDVLSNDEDPDGAASVLEPTTEVTGVKANGEGELVIPLTPERQVIVYSVEDEDEQVGRAVVIVPGKDSLAARRPVVRDDAPDLRVDAGSMLEIPLSKHVAVREGREPSAPFTENVLPGPGWDGTEKQKDPQTLQYRSTETFYGSTSITFLASDAKDEGDETALTSVLTLPIQVEADGHTAPRLTLPPITVEKGETTELDLTDYAVDPDPGDLEDLEFDTKDVPGDLNVSIDGSTLSVSADDAAQINTARQFVVTVTDGEFDVETQANVTVVSSTRPLMAVRGGTLDVKAGETVNIDVNDYVTNPFADTGESIKLVGAPDISGGKAAMNVTGDTTFTVTPDKAYHGILRARYVVADATEARDRQKQGEVTLRVRGVPDAPTAVVAEATQSQTVDVSWRAGANNGAPITKYIVSWNGGSREVGNQTSVTITGLTNNQEYTFTVVAVNEVGESPASAASRPARPDTVPDAPTGVAVSFGDQQLDVSWNAARSDGSPVEKYEVSYGAQRMTTAGPVTRVTLPALNNGTAYAVRVRAINKAETISEGTMGAGAWSSSVTEHPNAEPAAPATPVMNADGPDANPSALVSWNAPADGGHPIARYEVRKNGGAVIACAPVSTTSCRVALNEGEDSTYSVRAFNRANAAAGIDGWGPWSGNSASVRGATPPGPVSNLRANATGTSGRAQIIFTGANLHGAQSVVYKYQIAGGAIGNITSGQVVGGFADGSNRTISVWAVTTANGKTSAPGPTTSATGNSFAPCGVSVSRQSENYDNVTFSWSVTPNGRSCSYQSSGSGAGSGSVSGTTSAPRSGTQQVGDGKDQNVSFRLTVNTNTNVAGDANVGASSDVASGSTWNPTYTVSHGASCSSTATCLRVYVRVNDWRPNSNVRCFVGGSGFPDWVYVYSTNGSGDAPNNDNYLFDSDGDRFSNGTFDGDGGEMQCRQQ